MHSEYPYFTGKPSLLLVDQVGYYVQNAHTASALNGSLPYAIDPPMPFHKVGIQPSDACPKNFIIFDQTSNQSQIMFHPEMSSNLFHPGFDVDSLPFLPDANQVHPSDGGKMSSSFKEDSDDINALLSTEYEEKGECDDDDEVSTARTNAMHEYDSSDSYSNYESPSRTKCSLFRKSSVRRSNKRQQRVRKMVKALRRIVPETNRMSTVAVLDETIRYLKFLRVEVQKLGVGNTQV